MDGKLLVAMLVVPVACTSQVDGAPLVLSGSSMGTTWSAKLAAPPDGVAPAELESELAELLRSIDERMSTYRADSELSRFNASGSPDWFPVSADTAAVVAAALVVADRTGGAFDVTVGPMVNLWGFGPAGWTGGVPTEAALRAARASTGYTLLEARASPPALRMRAAERYVDLSGIAKGFAVDALAEHLEARGSTSYLVELGGELRARGRGPTGAAWRVGVERPAAGGRVVQRVLALGDRAVATSGDYRNFRTLGGERLGHVLDPRTGRPARTGVCSATVVRATAMEADALATALLVLGAEDGLRFAEREDLAVQLVLRDGGELLVRSTPRFDELVAGERGRDRAGLVLSALAVMLLAMTGLAAGLLLRGRPLRAACGREALATPEPSCSICPAPCPAVPSADDPRGGRHHEAHAKEARHAARP